MAAESRKPFHCRRCTWGRHCDESNPAPFPQWEIPEVIVSRTCLLPMITPASHFWLRLYGHYKKQFLPFAGGILQQPAKYIEAMELLETTFRRIEFERLEQAREDA